MNFVRCFVKVIINLIYSYIYFIRNFIMISHAYNSLYSYLNTFILCTSSNGTMYWFYFHIFFSKSHYYVSGPMCFTWYYVLQFLFPKCTFLGMISLHYFLWLNNTPLCMYTEQNSIVHVESIYLDFFIHLFMST